MKNHDDPFLKHLEYASRVVGEWPEWKRTALSTTWSASESQNESTRATGNPTTRPQTPAKACTD